MLTIIISTLNQGINNCINAVKIKDDRLKYIIIFQNNQKVEVPRFLQRSDIDVIETKSKGLSNSRNIGIENCKTPFALIADDDVEYIVEGLNQLIEVIENEVFDLAAFKIKTNPNESEYKSYPNQSYLMNNLITQHWVSSIEILVNIDKIRQTNLKFDNRFGLGTLLKKGEEQILLDDAIKRGLIVKFFPIYIVKHPFESSGKRKSSEKFNYFFKGAFDQRVNKRKCLSELWNLKFNLIRRLKIVICYYIGVFYTYISF